MGTLFGIVFLSHQLGSFAGVALGGILYDLYGTYEAVWWIAIALGCLAALIHWGIDEAPLERPITEQDVAIQNKAGEKIS
jgi:predicted MFS family arabinose efflux permease